MRLLACIVALVWVLPVHSAEIAKIKFGNIYGGVDIEIEGMLIDGDSQKFRSVVDSVLQEGLRIHSVRLNSPGGLVSQALEIGDTIRTLKLDTVAPTKLMWNATCESACFFIWAAGIDRYGEDIGIHRPYFDPRTFAHLSPSNAAAEYKKMADLVAGKLEGWGIPDIMVRRMLSASSKQMIPLSPDDFQLLRNDPAFSELLISRCGEEPYNPDKLSAPFYSDCQIAVINERLDEGIRQYRGQLNGEAQEQLSLQETVPIPTPAPSRRAVNPTHRKLRSDHFPPPPPPIYSPQCWGGRGVC
jgi:hypothetical protein